MLTTPNASAQLALQLLVKMDARKDLGALYAARGPHYLERAAPELAEMLDTQWTPQSAVQLALEQVLLSTDFESLLSVPSTSESLCGLFEAVMRVDSVKKAELEAPQDTDPGESNTSEGNGTRSASVTGSSLLATPPSGSSSDAVAGSKRRLQYARVLTRLLSRGVRVGAEGEGTEAALGYHNGSISSKRLTGTLSRLGVLVQADTA